MSTGATRIKAGLDAALREKGNDRCAECMAAHPRWASVNLGIFLCMRCASLHRQLGTHISRVKSTSLDSWTRDEVRYMRQVGNAKSNAVFNPRGQHPLALNDDERDSELDKFIRDKYQFRKFMATPPTPVPVEKSTRQSPGLRSLAEPPALPPSNLARDRTRAQSSFTGPTRSSTAPPLPSRSHLPSLPPLGSSPTGSSDQRQTSNPFTPSIGAGQAVSTVTQSFSPIGQTHESAASSFGIRTPFGPASSVSSPPLTGVRPAPINPQFTGVPMQPQSPGNPFATYHPNPSVPSVPSFGSSLSSTAFSVPSSAQSVSSSVSLGISAFGTAPAASAAPLFSSNYHHYPQQYSLPALDHPHLPPQAPPLQAVSPPVQQDRPSPVVLGSQAFAAPVLGQAAFAPTHYVGGYMSTH